MAESKKPPEGVYFEEEDEEGGENKKPGKPCEGSRKELVKCLKESDCIKVRKNTIMWPQCVLSVVGMYVWTLPLKQGTVQLSHNVCGNKFSHAWDDWVKLSICQSSLVPYSSDYTCNGHGC